MVGLGLKGERGDEAELRFCTVIIICRFGDIEDENPPGELPTDGAGLLKNVETLSGSRGGGINGLILCSTLVDPVLLVNPVPRMELVIGVDGNIVGSSSSSKGFSVRFRRARITNRKAIKPTKRRTATVAPPASAPTFTWLEDETGSAAGVSGPSLVFDVEVGLLPSLVGEGCDSVMSASLELKVAVTSSGGEVLGDTTPLSLVTPPDDEADGPLLLDPPVLLFPLPPTPCEGVDGVSEGVAPALANAPRTPVEERALPQVVSVEPDTLIKLVFSVYFPVESWAVTIKGAFGGARLI
jgi:hypothetical protein